MINATTNEPWRARVNPTWNTITLGGCARWTDQSTRRENVVAWALHSAHRRYGMKLLIQAQQSAEGEWMTPTARARFCFLARHQ